MADPFHLVRAKWAELPIGNERFLSTDLARLSDAELVAWFQTAATFSFARRTWRYVLYSDAFRGKRILDVGSGTGSDAVTFAKAGAEVTCLDLHASNLELIDRLARLWELPVETVVLEDFTSIDNLRGPFDVIWASGSLVNTPVDLAAQESEHLLQHLPVGGRWMELCYPEERWINDGRPALSEWGRFTDGEGTPWLEWYDLPKLLQRLAPAQFETVLAFNFSNDELNWFDLQRKA